MYITTNTVEPRYTVTLELTEDEAEVLVRFHGKFSHNVIKSHMSGCDTNKRQLMCKLNKEMYNALTSMRLE